MAEKYWCRKCKKSVPMEIGEFMHPDLGQRQAAKCSLCGGRVYLKEEDNGLAQQHE